MKIQINMSHGIHGDEESNAWIEKTLLSGFDRYKDRITRLDVHLADENASKGGGADKSCLIEIRLAGLHPITVDDRAATIASAINGATHKMLHRIENVLGRESHQFSKQDER